MCDFLLNPVYSLNNMASQAKKITYDENYGIQFRNLIEFCMRNSNIGVINMYFIHNEIANIYNNIIKSNSFKIFKTNNAILQQGLKTYINQLNLHDRFIKNYEIIYQQLKNDININPEEPKYYFVLNNGGLLHTNLLILYKNNVYSLDVAPEHKIQDKSRELIQYKDTFGNTFGRNTLSNDYLKSSISSLSIKYRLDAEISNLIYNEIKNNTISFFEYIKSKNLANNIFYNVGEIYTDKEDCVQKTINIINLTKENFEQNPDNFETLLISGMKKYGEQIDLCKRNTELNTNYFMASISDFEEHKNVVLLQNLYSITKLNKAIQDNLELRDIFDYIKK